MSKKFKVAFQGEKGAYSHLACLEIFPNADVKACKTFDEAFMMAKESSEYKIVIPITNSSTGSIADMHYLLPKYKLQIHAEHFQKVSHNLLGIKNSKIQDIKAVRSHAQALSQCSKIILENNFKALVSADTAGSAKLISEKKDKREAAIASELAAVIIKRPFGGQSLKLSATITKAGSPVTALKTISQDVGVAKAGTFIEYQVKFSNLSALKVGGVYVHTADGQVIGPSDAVQGMRLQADEDGGWIHSRLSLTPVKGKQIAAITVGTKVDSAPAGLFSMFVDNIQMTDGNKTLQPIWLSSANAGDTVAAEPYGDLIGVESLDIGVSDDVKIAVEPKNKVVTIWGKIKSVK